MPLYRESNNLLGDALPIPYLGLAESLYKTDRQALIPFLGAGSSLPPPIAGRGATDAPAAVDGALIERVCGQDLGITDPAARLLLELAIYVAMRMQSSSGANPPNAVLPNLVTSDFPPSAAQLAEAFAEASNYNHFEWAFQQVENLDPDSAGDPKTLLKVLRALSDQMGLGSSSPPLLEVASYYEYTFRREALRAFLSKIFNERKSQPTSTHTNVADAAKVYIDANKVTEDAEDYLIITTNYDGLIEIAFDRARVPYAVLTVPRDDWKVDVRLSDAVQEHLGHSTERYGRFQESIKRVPPRDFSALGKRVRPLVILYKVHGDLHPPNSRSRMDSIVISDDDYVRYINQDARIGMVPAMISELMAKKDLLILGYRFADWNIRSLYRSIVEKRISGDQRDWAILKVIGRYERGFFDTYDINMVETTLDNFWDGISQHRPPPRGN